VNNKSLNYVEGIHRAPVWGTVRHLPGGL